MRAFAIGSMCMALLVVGCTSDHWRAKTVESASNETSQVFAIDSAPFGSTLKVEKYRLSNGLKIILLEDRSAPVFAYHTWFNVGSRNERDGITGIAHLFEHLMFKETKNSKDGEFQRLLEEQGGRINAATYMDWTFYRESLPKEAFPMIPKLEANRMKNMILNDLQVNSEREVVANERRFRTDDSPSGSMYEALYKTAFTLHPYHWPVIGWMKDIESISTKDCLNFYSMYYAPNNATVVVVGDVQKTQVLMAINEAYGKIPASKIAPYNPPTEPKQTQERRVHLQKPIPAEKIIISYKIPNSLHTDYPALEVAHSILFNGRSSRLYRRLVTDTQIAGEAGGWVNQVKDPGLYIIDISMQPNRKATEAEKIVSEELQRLAMEEVPVKELEKAKNRLETSFWQNLKTVDDKAQAFGFYETVANDYRQLFNEVPSYQKITASDIARVAKTYFRPEARTIVEAKPDKGSDS